MNQNNQKHSFHLVDPSPWPLFSGAGAFFVTVGTVLYMHGYYLGTSLLFGGLVLLLSVMSLWFRDIIREGTFEGQHTKDVQTGLKYGMLLFIVSEVMFFFAFFWALFHSNFNPSPAIGAVWPPFEFECVDPYDLPLLNTILLLSSGASITWAHHEIVSGNKSQAVFGLAVTLALALAFMLTQMYEYASLPFDMSDGIYASTFFMLTGLHGFHVFVGAAFLSVCLKRLFADEFTTEHHVGFEAAAWYWHFVDVVWLFLFLTVYWWGA